MRTVGRGSIAANRPGETFGGEYERCEGRTLQEVKQFLVRAARFARLVHAGELPLTTDEPSVREVDMMVREVDMMVREVDMMVREVEHDGA